MISMMNVLDVEGFRSRLLENSIASTLLFVYFAYVVRYIFVVAGLLYVVVGTSRNQVRHTYMCVQL